MPRSESELAETRRENEQLSNLHLMAVRWWLTKQPVAWTNEQHRENPTINCVGAAERLLAKAVCALPWQVEEKSDA